MSGHIRQRSPGSWEIRYTIGADATGKRRVATATIRGGKRSAERELRRLLSAVDTGEAAIETGKVTVGAWIEQWLAMIRPELSPLTIRAYEQNARNYIVPALGPVALVKLTAANIQSLYSSLAEGGRADGRPGTLAASTRRLVHKTLHTALARALELQMINRNPALALRRRLPRDERIGDMVVLTAEQTVALLEAAGGSELFAPILLAVATGARRGEIIALSWRNVDLDKGGEILIAESAREAETGKVVIGRTKTGKSRRISLPATAIDDLRTWKRQQAEQLLRLGVRQGPDTPVCTRPDGSRLFPNLLSHGFARLVGRIGLPVHFHSLRHGHATALLAVGVHPKVMQERLGHASAAFTLNVYSHVADRLRDDAAERLDAILKR